MQHPLEARVCVLHGAQPKLAAPSIALEGLDICRSHQHACLKVTSRPLLSEAGPNFASQ
jgi:hypothetical protein